MIVTIRAESAEVDLGVLGLGLPATVDDPSSVEVDMAVLGGGLGVLYFTWRWTWSTVLYLEVDLGVLGLGAATAAVNLSEWKSGHHFSYRPSMIVNIIIILH